MKSPLDSRPLRMTRRRFLAACSFSSVACAIWAGTGVSSRSAVHAQVAAEPIRSEVTALSGEDWLAEGSSGVRVAGVDGTLTGAVASMACSRVVEAPFPFQAVGLKWRGDASLGFAVRSSVDGSHWSDWFSVQEELMASAAAEVGQATSLYFPEDGALHNFVQVRAGAATGQAEWQLCSSQLVFIDATLTGPTATAAAATVSAATESALASLDIGNAAEELTVKELSAALASKPAVISRYGWACPDPEGVLKDQYGFLLWPQSYAPVSHLILHHTATRNVSGDADYFKSVMRAIWRYHTYDLGWGDIGYNYVVDPNGAIYEGRAGGDDVIAGHTGTFNAYTLGLSLIGTFETVRPTAAALIAAERLMAWKCSQKGFSPLASSPIKQTCSGLTFTTANLAGHRDYKGYALNCYANYDPNLTACPGSALHAMLPEIRSETERWIVSSTAQLEGATIGLVAVGQLLTVRLTVRNIGSSTLRSGPESPSLIYDEGVVAQPAPVTTVRVGLDYSDRPSTAPAYPYRWGLGGDLAPGEARTLSCSIRITQESGPRTYRLGLVLEGVGMIVANVAPSVVYARVRADGASQVTLGRVSISPSWVFVDGLMRLEAEVLNWGAANPLTFGVSSGHVFTEGETCAASPVTGAFRVGLDHEGRLQVADHPYRWGIGAAPAQSRTLIEGYLRLPVAKPPRRFWAGLVEEGVRWVQDDAGAAMVEVITPKSRAYFPMVGR